MKLTDYYKMAKLPTCKSKLRFDCTTSTGGYEPFEERAQRGRDKRFKFYYGGTPNTFDRDDMSAITFRPRPFDVIKSVLGDVRFKCGCTQKSLNLRNVENI